MQAARKLSIEELRPLEDPHWRLRSLYKIIDKQGQEVTFVPNEHQERFYSNIWHRNLVLKARQLGYSTAMQLLMLDTCLFKPNQNAAVIAHDEDSATVIFRKIKHAYENLPSEIRETNPLAKDSASELMLANGSSLRVATSARSATLQMLHVSEFGKICAKYPDKAREVVTGSLPAAESGIICIESTAEGREGAFYEMTQKAKALSEAKKELSRLEYRFHFAPWWTGTDYQCAPELAVMTGVDHDYFDKLEIQISRKLSHAQRAWYVVTRENVFHGDEQLMRQEYPSTPDEAFEQSVDGVYYAKQLSLARLQGRICDVPHDPRLPVNTFWDLGRDDDLCIWFHQKVGGFDHWIDFYETSDVAFSHVTQYMQTLGYTWGKHYLPHDGTHRQYGIQQLMSPRDMLEQLGLRNIEIVPKTPDVTMAIRQCRDAFPKYRFDRTKTAPGLNHLEHYRKAWNERLGAWSEFHLKNGHQHAADALRQHAQMFHDETVTSGSRPKRRASAMAV